MPVLAHRLSADIGKRSLLHAILFPLSSYTVNDCLHWLRFHNLSPIHNRYTKNYHRFRIREQVKGMKFYTIKLNNGIELVYMY